MKTRKNIVSTGYKGLSKDRYDTSDLEEGNDWFGSETDSLPLWPEFILSSNWKTGRWFEHNNYYLYAFEMPLEGNLSITQRDRTTVINPGSVYLIHRGEDSRLETGPAGFCRKISMGMRGTALTSLMAYSGLGNQLEIKLEHPEKLLDKFMQVKKILQARKTEDIPLNCGLGMEIIIMLSRQCKSISDNSLASALNILSFNISRHISIQRVADELNLSISTLERLFRDSFGKTPKQYFIDLKMQTAKGLLSEGRLPVKAVAYHVGYRSSLHFSNEFRRANGMSPSEYREKMLRQSAK